MSCREAGLKGRRSAAVRYGGVQFGKGRRELKFGFKNQAIASQYAGGRARGGKGVRSG